MSVLGKKANVVANLQRQFGISEQTAEDEYEFMARNRFLGLAIGPSKKYYFVRGLGAGGFGQVWLAIAGKNPTNRPTRVVKRIIDQDLETGNGNNEFLGYNQDLEVEYLAGLVAARRLGESFCKTKLVCPLEKFYEKNSLTGYIVSRAYTLINLLTYLAMHVYSSMRQIERTVPDEFKDFADASQLVRDMQATGDPALKALISDVQTVQITCMALALQIGKTIALLHSVNIFHRDIKPENVIVKGGTKPENYNLLNARVIDLGLACVLPMAQDAMFDKSEKEKLSCGDSFQTTLFYEDPYAEGLNIGKMTRGLSADAALQEKAEKLGKFDTYSVGKLFQNIFDRETINESGTDYSFPVVRQTKYMPPGVYDLIVDMTGEAGFDPGPISGSNYRWSLSAKEKRLRKEAFERRPTMGEVVVRLANLTIAWRNSAR